MPCWVVRFLALAPMNLKLSLARRGLRLERQASSKEPQVLEQSNPLGLFVRDDSYNDGRIVGNGFKLIQRRSGASTEVKRVADKAHLKLTRSSSILQSVEAKSLRHDAWAPVGAAVAGTA